MESDEYETEQVEAIEPNVVIPEIIRSVVKQGDEFPDVQKREEMAGKIAELGFSVTRYNQNMLNYEKVDEFLRNVADGIEGEVTVYTYPWIYVISETFSYKNGEMTCTLKHYTADEVREPITLKVDEFEYTERGNFIYRLEESGDEYRGFRVTPLSEKSRTYFQKYIMPGNIFMSGPVNINWNKDNFGDLNWDWIFEKLWEYENGTDMFNTEYYREARDNFHFDYVEIPREVVEELLQKYFYVPTDILRNIDEYNEEDKTYTFP
ncbi:MAG TPA: hypothetical protein GX526_07100 [Thermoanaerobacterales bacterium]|nr:hypothetical protein [Thermoanaerobacterales bacterium]